MPDLYLVRGCPGAGKSTLAKSLGDVGVCADEWFNNFNRGVFDASKLEEAHQWCRDCVEDWMKYDEDIAVHNTFTREWEMKPYYDLAEQYDYRVFSIIVENRHFGRSIHNVPQETLDKMKNRFDVKL